MQSTALGDWILIYGNWGAPAMGVVGSGWLTAISRAYMVAVLIGFALVYDLRHRTGLIRVPMGLSLSWIGRLVVLGLPAAVHVTLEVGVFAVATVLAGMLDPVDLAAHDVVLDIASVTFMIPLGLATAGAVRVGQALGRGEPSAAGHAGWTALTLGAGFMAFAGLVFASVPGPLVSVFTTDPAVIATAGSLMIVAAAFQLFDGLQGVSTGSPCAGPAIPTRPWSATSFRTGASACRSATCCASAPASASSACGPGWRWGWPRPGSTCSRPGPARPGHSPEANTSWPG